MNIDWSKAPAWATAVGKHNISLAWICDSGYCFQGIYNPPCHPFKENSYSLKDFSVVERRPWPGNGLPPVGTVCECHLPGELTNNYSWVQAKVIWHNGPTECAVIRSTSKLAWCDEFRPIRTPEQIAADERLHEIRNALTAIKAGQQQFPNDLVRGNIVVATVEAMIDAGYRKQLTP